jgi:streptogramin lyase
VGTVAAAVSAILVITAPALLASGWRRADHSLPAHHNKLTTGLSGWRVAREITVPHDGNIWFTGDAVWVVDRDDGRLRHGVPAGATYLLDPATGEMRERIAGAVGAWPAVGAGAVWMATHAMDPAVVTRVDLATHAVTRIPVIDSDVPQPTSFAVAQGKVWLGDCCTNMVAALDPRTGTVGPGSPVPGNFQQFTATDGSSVFLPTWESEQVVRIDARTGQELSRVATGFSGTRGQALLYRDGTLYAGADGLVLAIDVSRVGAEKVIGQVRLSKPGDVKGSQPQRLVAAYGSIWTVRDIPSELVRIDSRTLTVTGRWTIPGNIPNDTPAFGRDLAVGGGSIWLRTIGKVLQLQPVPSP